MPAPEPDDRARRRYPRIGGYGGYGADLLAAALCAACPGDVHGHVEVFRAGEERVEVRVGLLCGADHLPWRYTAVCDPWEVDGAIRAIVLAAWR